MDQYKEAHLFVAAIRLIEHRSKSAATIDDVCSMLEISLESGHRVCRRLEQKGIITFIEDPFSLRLSIDNHLEIEMLPKEEEDKNSLADEIAQFKANKKEVKKEVETIQAELEKKRKSIFSDLEKKLKKEMRRK